MKKAHGVCSLRSRRARASVFRLGHFAIEMLRAEPNKARLPLSLSVERFALTAEAPRLPASLGAVAFLAAVGKHSEATAAYAEAQVELRLRRNAPASGVNPSGPNIRSGGDRYFQRQNILGR